ncbi:uncharacterized protein LOC110616205 isoform X1 [Manihot esculenta]|uniref:Uncharacterized protein n=2 Tax=Manihot esculenta TaxID=3983 RepID=A0ACB7HT38_MANES|nr:uncharacterized protein LOC110616205 isoform X1 [Manihot esculenta]XP_021614245.1 uncharacterized protein LOC110616205 isoform X1 [Manihot esculenta]KAG8654842.1 hypothetical protein MANES_05G185500v8 [Manihot esculenta]KAG8654843.1 hypothetical protein MANES_05G185500v8 [Manihot esculenta]
MLKQSPNRNQRSKGFKVKHFLQICLLLVICIWLLNQLKLSYDKKNSYDSRTGEELEKVQREHENIKLGRKDLLPRVDETTLEGESKGDKAELEEGIEEIKPEEVEDDGRGGGDDEIERHDQDRTEEEESDEVEDLIDVDDRERDVGTEEHESEEKSNQLEDASSINHRAQNGGTRNSQEAREEHYKGDDASSSVVHNIQNLSSEFQIGGLRRINVAIGLKRVVTGEEKDEFNSANSYTGSESSSLTEAVANQKPKIELNPESIIVEMLETIHHLNATATGEPTFLQAASREQNGSSGEAKESTQSNANSTFSAMSGSLGAVNHGAASVSKPMVNRHTIKLDPSTSSERNKSTML